MFSRLPRQVTSHQGYEGCLASLDLNGESPNLLTDAAIQSPQVVEGCAGEFIVEEDGLDHAHGVFVHLFLPNDVFFRQAKTRAAARTCAPTGACAFSSGTRTPATAT